MTEGRTCLPVKEIENVPGDEPNPLALEVEGDEYVPMQPLRNGIKQSHLCCGCCCDTRRAVIVVDIISLSFAAMAILSMVMVTSDGYAATFDDDEVQEAFDEIDGAKVGMTICFASVGMMCNLLGIFGAVKFNRWAVLAAGIWYFVEFVRSIVFFDIAGAIMAGFFAYPHFVFWQEIRKGIMTSIRYPNEERCCNCC